LQDVDFMGRFCQVKWFKTYTEGTQPEPVFLESTQCSVYDLKDHPDFKYRPGAIVIRLLSESFFKLQWYFLSNNEDDFSIGF